MQRRRLPYLPALDGIRGLSVAAVLAFHAGPGWLSGGFLGVSTFFTLSGFLITSLLFAEVQASGRIRLAEFWTRRFRRLMPAALLTLLGVALYAALAADPSQLWRLRGDGLASLFYYANWQLLFSGQAYEELFVRPSPVQHFWSLSIEEQFYFVFPLLFLALCRVAGGSRAVLSGALAALAAGSLALTAWLHQPESAATRVYFGTDTRAAELLVGALLALALAPLRDPDSRRAPTWLALLGVGGLAATGWLWANATLASGWLFEGGLGAVSLASAALIAAASFGGPFARVLAFEPLRLLGLISYGVYLIHWPVYLWLDVRSTGLGPPALLALRVGVTLALATLSYVCVENPIRKGRVLPRFQVWKAAPVALAATAAALLFVTRDLVVPRTLQHPLLGGRPMPPPLHTQARAELPRAIVFGDSVASTLGDGLVRWGRHAGRANVWNLASYGCGLTHGTGAIDNTNAFGGEARCGRGADWWRIQLAAFRPEVVFVMAGLWDLRDRRLPQWTQRRAPGDPVFDEWLLGEFELALDTLAEGGARVVWLTYPCISPDPGAGIVLGPLGNTAALEPARLAHLNRVLLPELLRRRPGGFELIDLDARVCPGGEFQAEVEGVPDARPDGVHFSLPAADRLASVVGPVGLGLAPAPLPAPAEPIAALPEPPAAPAAPAARAKRSRAPRPPLVAPLAPEPELTLEKLLQLPPGDRSRSAVPDLQEVLRRARASAAAGKSAKTGDGSRVRIDVDLRTDTAIEYHDLKREQLDAGAAIDIDESTSLKGGLRVERDSQEGVESSRKTTPTIGIEKRF
jgi:peptidoglycan/LPS O-acetylase OafA/YrhL